MYVKHQARLNAQVVSLLEAARALFSVVDTCKRAPVRLTHKHRADLFDQLKRYAAISKKHKASLPKDHLMVHLLDRTQDQGDPWPQATWLDESLNQELKGWCKGCHASTFEAQVLAKAEKVLPKMGKRLRLASGS